MANTDDSQSPGAVASPIDGYDSDNGKRGLHLAVSSTTAASYGFTIIAKIIPNREHVFYDYAKKIKEELPGTSDLLHVLRLHYLRWVLFPINGELYFMYQGIFDSNVGGYAEDAAAIFETSGLNIIFENLEGFPGDWKTNASALDQFIRDHQCPSFLEYGEYPFVSADEIKKALRLKAAFSEMLDDMQ